VIKKKDPHLYKKSEGLVIRSSYGFEMSARKVFALLMH
jgi:hypothetical protein